VRTALLIVETDRVKLTWSGHPPPATVPGTSAPGEAIATARRPGLETITLSAGDENAQGRVAFRLFEQRDYQLAVYAKQLGVVVQVRHRDPAVLEGQPELAGEPGVSCAINFGSQVGRTRFFVLVDGEPEFDLELEVSATKLDYAVDFEHLLADVQQIATGLVLSYLRATYQLGAKFHADRSSELEWILLLRHVATDLGKALRFIAAQPIRGLTRVARYVPAGRVRRVDAALRADIVRGRGRGPTIRAPHHPPVRARLAERHPAPTLDTVEHRWLAEQVRRCQHRVAIALRDALGEAADPNKPRARQVVRELEQLERQLAELAKLEPLAAATGLPPAGFASLQLLSAPGYGEAYQHCMILGLGLRIEGGPFEVSLKDLSKLYEYWCYLSVLQIIAETTQSEIPARDLVVLHDRGLRILLQEGSGSRVTFGKGSAREIDVIFNPTLTSPVLVTRQEPDILISLRAKDWPTMELVIDAKYRVEASPAYLRLTGNVPGPPQEAINTLHRYRDAILAQRPSNEWVDDARPKDNRALVRPSDRPGDRPRSQRSVVHAIALYPGTTPPEAFQASTLWRAIADAGIGAIPALPGHLALVRQWLRGALADGGWALADLAPRHAAIEQAHGWQRAASQPVLIGVLRGQRGKGDRATRDHLAWIIQERKYYLPETESQPRQRGVHKIAFYEPAAARAEHEGAITHVAEVDRFEIVPRRAIATPWPAARDPDEAQVLYHLRRILPLARAIANTTDRGRRARLSGPRWTSALGLLRARNLHELLLETEPEWRLLEMLDARGAIVHFEPQAVRALDPDNPSGRTWLRVGQRRARFAGASGFLLEEDHRRTQQLASLDAAFAFLTDAKLAGP
jgi:hypothetical protein